METRLDQLVSWKVLTRWQEPARTEEDFLRRRDRHQLTPAAARFHTFWTSQGDLADDAAADLTLAACQPRPARHLRRGDPLQALPA
jgi:hypothetical protein